MLGPLALDNPVLVAHLVGLVRTRNAQDLARILNKKSNWPGTTIGKLLAAVWDLKKSPHQPKTDMLQVIVPHAHSVTPKPNDVKSVVSAFFSGNTPAADRAWMEDTLIPSLNPHTHWGRDMMQCVWWGAFSAIENPARVSSVPAATVMSWLTAHTTHCPELTRPPTPQECTAAREGRYPGSLPYNPSDAHNFVNKIILLTLQGARENDTRRYTELLNALADTHPCVLSWATEHVCMFYRSSVADVGSSSRLSHLSGLLDDLVARVPQQQAHDLAQWMVATTKTVSPSINALACAAVITSALPNAHEDANAPRARM